MPGRHPARTRRAASRNRAGGDDGRQRAGGDDRRQRARRDRGRRLGARRQRSITVGSADFPESQLLAQIYGQALAAAGFDVSYDPASEPARSTSAPSRAARSQLVPEYTNSLLSFVLRQSDPNAVPDATNVEEQVAALGEALPEGLEVLTPSTAEDKDVIVCTRRRPRSTAWPRSATSPACWTRSRSGHRRSSRPARRSASSASRTCSARRCRPSSSRSTSAPSPTPSPPARSTAATCSRPCR